VTPSRPSVTADRVRGRVVTLLDAPSNLGLRPPAPGRAPGVVRMPEALRRAGLAARLGAAEGGRVAAPTYRPEIDARTGIRNAAAIRAYSVGLADRVKALLDRGAFPLVLGGDGSILLGTLLGLHRRGRHGLLFVDGHTDFLTPATSRTGGAAGMDLALATGRGPAELADLEGRRPLVRDEDVTVLGYRDVGGPAIYPARAIFATAMRRADLAGLRTRGICHTRSPRSARTASPASGSTSISTSSTAT